MCSLYITWNISFCNKGQTMLLILIDQADELCMLIWCNIENKYVLFTMAITKFSMWRQTYWIFRSKLVKIFFCFTLRTPVNFAGMLFPIVPAVSLFDKKKKKKNVKKVVFGKRDTHWGVACYIKKKSPASLLFSAISWELKQFKQWHRLSG